MKKQVTAVLLALCMTLELLPVQAWAAETPDAGAWGTNLTWVYDAGTKTLAIRGTGPMSGAEIDMPEEAELWKESVTQVVIEPGVTAVGASAFKSWTALTRVSLPAGLTAIGREAFSGCTSLTGINIPETVTYVGPASFAQTNISEITIPQGVLAIDYYTFKDCTSLNTAAVPSSLINIRSGAFQGCTALTHVNGLKNVRRISEMAFDGCSALKSIELNENVVLYGGAFRDCSSLTSVVIPGGCTLDTVGGYSYIGVFQGCSSLSNLVIEEGVTTIGRNMFKDCSSLKTIAFPESVTGFPSNCLQNCMSMETIRLGISKCQQELDPLNYGLDLRLIKEDQWETITIEYALPSGERTENQTYLATTADYLTRWWYDGEKNILNFVFSSSKRYGSAFYTIKQPTDDSNPLKWDQYLDKKPMIVVKTIAPLSESSISRSKFTLVVEDGVFPEGTAFHVYSEDEDTEFRKVPEGMSVHTLQRTLLDPSYATCKQTGSTVGHVCQEKTCPWAEQFAPKQTPQLPHDIVGISEVAASCTIPGTAYGQECKSCKEVLLAPVETPVTGHTYSPWFTSVQPTDTTPGVSKRVCKDCKDEDTAEIPALNPDRIYQITFHLNNYSGKTVVQSTKGGKLTAMPEDPENSGYRFQGWFTSQYGGEPVTLETEFTKDSDVHAHWERLPGGPYTITFDPCFDNGHVGTYHTLTTAGDGTVLASTWPSQPSKGPDYQFAGWFTEKNGGEEVTVKTVFTGSITVYAHYIEKPAPAVFTILLNPQSGELPEGQPDRLTTDTSGRLAVLPAPTRGGHTFAGWYTDPSGGEKVTLSTVFTADTTIYAHWTATAPKLYTVTFDSQGGSAVSSQSVASGGKAAKPADPSLASHIFEGWYREAVGTTPWTFDTDTVTGDLTLYAKWTPISCRVAFDLNGGDGPAGSFPDQTVPYGGKAAVPATAPTRTGHTFGGWYREAACTTPWSFDADSVTGDLTLYARWTLTYYPVSFDLNGAGATGAFPEISVAYGQKIPAPITDPDWTDHIFEGWYREAGGINAWDFDQDTVSEATTLYAKWRERTAPAAGFIITFDRNDGQGGVYTTRRTDENGYLNSLPPGPTPPSGYRFAGWYDEKTGGTEIPIPCQFHRDFTLYAHWTPDTPAPRNYTVTFRSQGGSAVASQTVADGGRALRPANPTRAGHIFGGWYKEAACTNAWNFASDTVTGDLTLYAKWTAAAPSPGPWTVTFALNYTGAPAAGTVQVSDGGKVQKPANPTRAGHIFGGWHKEAACTTEWNFDTDTVTKDTTLYAKWTPDGGRPDPDNPVTVTFDPNGGTGGGTMTTGTGGRLAALPGDPVRGGYTFAGWYTGKNDGTEVTTATVFTADTTVYAHWNRGADASIYYRIYTPYRTPGGRFDVSHTSAAEGTRVTIELSPRRGYEVDWVSATNLVTGREVRLTGYYSDEYSFIMPAGDVEVEIAFADRDSGGSSGSSGGSYDVPNPLPASTKPVRWYYNNGAIYHVVDGLVPAGTWLTRDMLISILYNLDSTSTGEPEFWAVSHSVVPDIYKSWLWGVDKPVSREQAVVILFSYAQYKNYNTFERTDLTGYTDYGLIRPIAQPAMSWARATGLIAGTSANTLSPRNNLTCGQANVILSRFTGKGA